MIEIHEIGALDGFRGLKHDWDPLLSRSGADTIYLTFDWMYSWWKFFGSDKSLRILVVSEDGRLIAIAPFYTHKSRMLGVFPARSLSIIGSYGVSSEYLDIIADIGAEERACQCVSEYLVQRMGRDWDVLDLRRVPEGSTLQRLLIDRRQEFGLSAIISKEFECANIELMPTWEGQLKSVSKRFRKEIRKKRRLLSEQGAVAFRVCKDENDLDSGFNELIRLHKRRWQSAGRPGSFGSDRYVQFHRAIASTLMKQGKLLLGFLYVNDTPVAVKYGFMHNGVYYAHQGGWDPAWKDLSIGLTIQGMSIEYCIERGLKYYDFLTGGEQIKFRWTDQTRTCRDLILTNSKSRKVYLHIYDALYKISRRVANKVLPASVRDRLAVYLKSHS